MSVMISKNRLAYALIVADRREVMPIMLRETDYEYWTICVFTDGAWKVKSEKGASL
jgi:hypothetical protein